MGSNVSQPLSIGVTFDISSISGTTPCRRDRLKIQVNASLILRFASLMHFIGTPMVALLIFRFLIRSDTSKVQIPLNMKLLVNVCLMKVDGSVSVTGSLSARFCPTLIKCSFNLSHILFISVKHLLL